MELDKVFYAVLTGMLLGFLYDIMRFVRIVFKRRFFPDFLFWIISAFCVYTYILIFNNGNIRIAFFVIILVGFLLYIYTLGYITKRFEKYIFKLLQRLKIWTKNKTKKLKKLLHSLYNIYYNKKSKKKQFYKNKNKGDRNEENEEEKLFN